MKNLSPYLFILLIMYIAIGFFSYCEYRDHTNVLHATINKAFNEAVEKDYEIRLKRNNLTFSSSTYPMQDSLPLKKGIKIGSSSQMIIPYEKKIQKDVSQKNMVKSFEYILNKVSPINPCELDSIFINKLQKQSIQGKTNVCIVINNQETYCTNKEKVDNSYFSTEFIEQGFKPIVKLQGFVKYNSWKVFQEIKTIWIIVFVLTAISIRIIKKKRKDKYLINLEKKFEFKWTKLENSTYQFENVNFDPSKKTLFDTEKKEYVLLTDQLAEALLLFLKEENHCVNIKDIATLFWPDIKDHNILSQRTSKLISKLKEKLSTLMIVDFEKSGTVYIFRCRKNGIKTIIQLEKDEYAVGDYIFNANKKILRIDGINHSISTKIAKILELLIQRSGNFIKSEDLIEAVIKKKEEEVNRENLNSQLEATIIKAQEALNKDKDLEIIGSIEFGYKLVLNNPTNKK